MGEQELVWVQSPFLSLSFHVETILNQPPTEVILEGLYFKFIDYLKDYKLATSDWRKILIEDLKETYEEVLTYADVDGVSTNPYYRLITIRPLSEHLILSKSKHNVI